MEIDLEFRTFVFWKMNRTNQIQMGFFLSLFVCTVCEFFNWYISFSTHYQLMLCTFISLFPSIRISVIGFFFFGSSNSFATTNESTLSIKTLSKSNAYTWNWKIELNDIIFLIQSDENNRKNKKWLRDTYEYEVWVKQVLDKDR